MAIAGGAPYFVACRMLNNVGGERMVMVREIILVNYLRSGEKYIQGNQLHTCTHSPDGSRNDLNPKDPTPSSISATHEEVVLVEVRTSYYQSCWCCVVVNAATTHSTFSKN